MLNKKIISAFIVFIFSGLLMITYANYNPDEQLYIEHDINVSENDNQEKQSFIEAENAVLVVESSMLIPDYNYAISLVNVLPKGEEKTLLLERLSAIVINVKDE